MNKIIKDQINLLKPSATLAINEESNRLKKEGKKIYKFGFGQSPFPVPESIVLALRNNANKNTYLPMQGLEELRLAIADHLNENNRNDFIHFYQVIDILIVDEVQFLSGKSGTQDVFFHIFNHLHQNGKQVILTSDKAPLDMQDSYASKSQSTENAISYMPSPCIFNQSDPGCDEFNGVVMTKY